MSDKLLEFIRQILIKTVLPLEKRKEKFLSQFRFSIVFRTSLNYVKLLMIYGVFFFVVLMIIVIQVETNQYKTKAKAIINQLEEGIIQLNENEYSSSINPYRYNGLSMRITSDNRVLYNDIRSDVSKDKSLNNQFSYHYKENKSFIVKYKNYYITEGKKCVVYFQFDISEGFQGLGSILLWAILSYVGLICLVMKFGQKGILKLFEPINEIAATANRLNVNNLHNERLNIEGTKNELKDLATTINQMLDRIELSYESQKQFVSDASHELRTPIAVVQGYANLLDRWGSKDEDVLEESIEAIRNEAKSMQDLVEKLLFLSRHDKKTLKLTKIKFNMKPVVEEMVKETNLVVVNREITCPVLEDVITYGDKQALKQAVRVFIDNAVKYTKDGDQITVLCENKDGDCVVTVTDTGIGMTKEDVDHIFERFFRSDHVRNEKISGHGLGLSIAKLIVLKHTGSIKVRTQYTKGSSFTITIPKNMI